MSALLVAGSWLLEAAYLAAAVALIVWLTIGDRHR